MIFVKRFLCHNCETQRTKEYEKGITISQDRNGGLIVKEINVDDCYSLVYCPSCGSKYTVQCIQKDDEKSKRSRKRKRSYQDSEYDE